MIRNQGEPQLVKSDNELPSVMFDRTELSQWLIWESDTLSFLSDRQAVGNLSKMFHRKPKWLRSVSMEHGSWNADELDQLPNRRE